MNNIKGWNKWYIHPFTFVYLFMAIYTKCIDIYLITLLIVCFHEFCHYLFAKYFNFNIGIIKILPFGVFMELQDYGIRRVDQEAVVILAGLCSHAFLYCFFKLLNMDSIWFSINQTILLFNLLPIYPLDGSKLLLHFLCLFSDYQHAIQLQIKISLLVLSLMVVLFFDVSFIFVFCYLFYSTYKYIKEYRFMIIRLLLNRNQGVVYKNKQFNYDLNFYRTHHNYYFTNNGFIDEIFMIEKLIFNIKSSSIL